MRYNLENDWKVRRYSAFSKGYAESPNFLSEYKAHIIYVLY